MRTSHLLTIGAAAALATGANAAILVLDHFSGNPAAGSRTGVGVEPTDYGISDKGFQRGIILEMQSALATGDPKVEFTILPLGTGTLNFRASDSADGKLTLKYGDFGDASNPELNLDRSMYTLAGAIGLYIEGWNADFAVPLSVTIYDTATDGWSYNVMLPAGGLASLIVDGTSFVPFGGPSLADIDSIVYAFDPPLAGDFQVDALGIPEPHEYAVVAGLGLLGFAAFRRLQRKS